jgi:hypothetical protein
MLDGLPSELRKLADDLDGEDELVEIELASPQGAALRRCVTDDERLRVSVEPGPILVIEGNRKALRIAIEPMRGVADAAVMAAGEGGARHAHIEYLGETDGGRAPDSFPLIIGERRPRDGA